MSEADKHVPLTDVLTPLATMILQTDAGVSYQRLLVKGPGSAEGKRLLTGVRPEQLIARPIADDEAANGVLAGLWLWHDWLDASHDLSQKIASPTGSFWHAIMHRREGDFWNAKYWYARCRTHPVLRVLAVRASSIAGDPAMRGTQLAGANGFDADAFVDLVEQVSQHPDDPRYAGAVEVQRLEWETLFADCVYAASGVGSILGGGME